MHVGMYFHEKSELSATKTKMATMSIANAILLFCVLCLALALVSHADDRSVFLSLHAQARKAVGVAALQWSSTLEEYATDYSQRQASNGCQLVHSHGPYGENIYWGYGAGYEDPEAAMKLWVDDEKDYYDYDNNVCLGGKDCLHYTQVVWKNTKQVGCGTATCSNGEGVFVTCNYYSPGNIEGQRPY